MQAENYIRIPLYKLYYIEDIASFKGLTSSDILNLKKEYTHDELSKIKESLEWAMRNPEYDFASLLPNLKYKNDEIYSYLRKINSSFII